MMRKCHLNTCPVGVATQDPVLRAFRASPSTSSTSSSSSPRKCASSWRSSASASFDELIGRADLLDTRKGVEHWKARGSTSRASSTSPMPAEASRANVETQDHGLDKALDHKLIEARAAALERGEKVSFIDMPIRNVNRTVGAMLSGEVARATATTACPTTRSTCSSTARRPELRRLPRARRHARPGRRGQRLRRQGPVGRRASSCARPDFRGEGRREHHRRQHRAVRRDRGRGLLPRRRRRALRGAQLRRDRVVEGTGDHGCEYMTGGTVVVLGGPGATSRPACRAASPTCSTRTATSSALQHGDGRLEPVLSTVEQRAQTVSTRPGTRGECRRDHPEAPDREALQVHRQREAREILDDWENARGRFVKVFPTRVPARARRARRGAQGKRSRRAAAGFLSAPARRRCDTVQTHREEDQDGQGHRIPGVPAPAEASEAPQRGQALQGVRAAPDDAAASKQGARCMDCGIPFCQSGCPVNNIIPDWNDLVFKQTGASARRPALDQQLPRVHRPRLPRALRGRVHAEHQQRRRSGIKSIEHAIIDKAWERAGSCRSRRPQDRQARRGRRLRPGRAGRRAAARARRPRRHGVREERPDRRAAALRHPRLQDGEVAHRPPRRADAGRRRDLPHRRVRRHRSAPDGVAELAKETVTPGSCWKSSTRWC
jgi:glutamate synthase domain-containing protein 3